MRTFLLLVFCLGLAGCKSQCRMLSEEICKCALNSNDKSNCLTRAGNAEGANPPSAAEEVFCRDALLSRQCDCRLIETASGKIRCGLARDPNAVLVSAADAGT